MINEEACLMPDLKECKHFMPWFDALFIRNQELWFGRYNAPVKACSDTITLITYSGGASVSMLKEDALCFFDKDNRRWDMILSKHCRASWQVYTEEDDIYLRMLASIAEDELKGSRGDHNDLAITNRIKNRYRTWFEERNIKKSYIIPGTRNNADYDYYGIRGQKYAQVRYQSYPQCKPLPPQPKFVQFNDDITTVVWQDGSHTIVKRTRGDAYDEEKAIAMAVIKKMCGNNGCEMDRYFNKFFEHSVDISNSKKKKGAKKK